MIHQHLNEYLHKKRWWLPFVSSLGSRMVDATTLTKYAVSGDFTETDVAPVEVRKQETRIANQIPSNYCICKMKKQLFPHITKQAQQRLKFEKPTEISAKNIRKIASYINIIINIHQVTRIEEETVVEKAAIDISFPTNRSSSRWKWKR